MSKKKKQQRITGKRSRVRIAQQQQKEIALLAEGKSQLEIAELLGLHPVTVCRNLKELRKQFEGATIKDFEVYRKGQLAVLEMMEEALLEGKLHPALAREWREIRSDIAKLLGLNAPDRSQVAVEGTINYDAGNSMMSQIEQALMKELPKDEGEIIPPLPKALLPKGEKC